MAFDDFIDAADGGFELGEILAAVVRQRHLGKHPLHGAQILELEMGAVAGNEAGLLQSFAPDQAGARRQADGVGQIHIRDPSVALQMTEDADVDLGQLGDVSRNPSKFRHANYNFNLQVS